MRSLEQRKNGKRDSPSFMNKKRFNERLKGILVWATASRDFSNRCSCPEGSRKRRFVRVSFSHRPSRMARGSCPNGRLLFLFIEFVFFFFSRSQVFRGKPVYHIIFIDIADVPNGLLSNQLQGCQLHIPKPPVGVQPHLLCQ